MESELQIMDDSMGEYCSLYAFVHCPQGGLLCTHPLAVSLLVSVASPSRARLLRGCSCRTRWKQERASCTLPSLA